MTTLYEKRGRRYYPVSEVVRIDALPEGSYLVTVRPGLKTVLCDIEPDHASLIAAAEEAKEAMCKAIQAAMARKPNRPLTKRQREILDQFIAAGGFPMFSMKCAADIASAGIGALVLAAAGKRAKEAA